MTNEPCTQAAIQDFLICHLCINAGTHATALSTTCFPKCRFVDAADKTKDIKQERRLTVPADSTPPELEQAREICP